MMLERQPEFRGFALQRFQRQDDIAEELRVVFADRNAGSGGKGEHVRRRRFAAVAAVELGDLRVVRQRDADFAARERPSSRAPEPPPPPAQAPPRRRPFPSRRRRARRRCRDLAEARRGPHAHRRRRRRGALVTGAVWGITRELLLPVVGFDDARDEIAAHDVGVGEADRFDAGNAIQQRDRLLEARLHAAAADRSGSGRPSRSSSSPRRDGSGTSSSACWWCSALRRG